MVLRLAAIRRLLVDHPLPTTLLPRLAVRAAEEMSTPPQGVVPVLARSTMAAAALVTGLAAVEGQALLAQPVLAAMVARAALEQVIQSLGPPWFMRRAAAVVRTRAQQVVRLAEQARVRVATRAQTAQARPPILDRAAAAREHQIKQVVTAAQVS